MTGKGKMHGASAISSSDTKSITVRGHDLMGLMGTVSFSEFFVLLLLGRLPDDNERFMLDACLVAIAEHGLTPSVKAARMTRAADPAALQGAVAAGILGCGTVVLGTAELAAKLLVRAVALAAERKEDAESVAREICAAEHVKGARLPGFGHPLHRPEDPRAQRLFELAEQRGTAGPHVRMARAFAACVDEIYARRLPLNVSGAIGAVMLDIGFPIEVMKGVPILARTAGIIAHLRDDVLSPMGFDL